jgi:hypothetical protein
MNFTAEVCVSCYLEEETTRRNYSVLLRAMNEINKHVTHI